MEEGFRHCRALPAAPPENAKIKDEASAVEEEEEECSPARVQLSTMSDFHSCNYFRINSSSRRRHCQLNS